MRDDPDLSTNRGLEQVDFCHAPPLVVLSPQFENHFPLWGAEVANLSYLLPCLTPFHSANQRPPSKCLSPSRSNHRMPCPMTWRFAQSPVAQAILASFHIRLLSSKDGYQSADSIHLGTGTLFLIKFFLIILPCPQNKISIKKPHVLGRFAPRHGAEELKNSF